MKDLISYNFDHKGFHSGRINVNGDSYEDFRDIEEFLKQNVSYVLLERPWKYFSNMPAYHGIKVRIYYILQLLKEQTEKSKDQSIQDIMMPILNRCTGILIDALDGGKPHYDTKLLDINEFLKLPEDQLHQYEAYSLISKKCNSLFELLSWLLVQLVHALPRRVEYETLFTEAGISDMDNYVLHHLSDRIEYLVHSTSWKEDKMFDFDLLEFSNTMKILSDS